MLDARMAGSTKGSATPEEAAANPAIIAPTKAVGQAHKARPPPAALHRPTVTMARM